MRNADSTPILKRLLDVTTASRDAFARAARAVRSSGLAALLAQRASDQARIGSYLSKQLGLPSLRFLLESATPHVVEHGEAYGATNELPDTSRAEKSIIEIDALLGECIRHMDAAILEFRSAHGRVMSLTERILFDRHQDQMGWAREELLHLRSERKAPRFQRQCGDTPVHLHLLGPTSCPQRPTSRLDGLRSRTRPRGQVENPALSAER